jgi:hypothetical protein
MDQFCALQNAVVEGDSVRQGARFATSKPTRHFVHFLRANVHKKLQKCHNDPRNPKIAPRLTAIALQNCPLETSKTGPRAEPRSLLTGKENLLTGNDLLTGK